MLTPEDVFTTELPLKPQNVYSPRREPEAALQRAFDRGKVALVYGEYGVGKTSMVRHQVKRFEEQSRLVNVPSLAGKNFANIIEAILEHLGYAVTESTVQTSLFSESRGIRGSTSGGLPPLSFQVQAEKKSTTSSSVTTENRLVVKTPTDTRVLKVCDDAKLCVMLDELHKSDQQMHSDLAVFIKTIANLALKNFRLILLGTSSSTSELVAEDLGVDRLLEEVEVTPMVWKERFYLIEHGMHKLEIAISDDQISSLARKCVGAPVVLQFLCLETAIAAFQRKPRIVRDEDITAAVEQYMKTRATRLARTYATAISTTGERRYRNRILEAVASIDDDYVTMEQICEHVSGSLGFEVESTALSGPLRQLKSKRHGGILKDVERLNEEGGRIYNSTTFSDPAMKAYVRMRLESGQVIDEG